LNATTLWESLLRTLCDAVSRIEGDETVLSLSISLDHPSGLSSGELIYVVK
jgi:hypothetical protein